MTKIAINNLTATQPDTWTNRIRTTWQNHVVTPLKDPKTAAVVGALLLTATAFATYRLLTPVHEQTPPDFNPPADPIKDPEILTGDVNALKNDLTTTLSTEPVPISLATPPEVLATPPEVIIIQPETPPETLKGVLSSDVMGEILEKQPVDAEIPSSSTPLSPPPTLLPSEMPHPSEQNKWEDLKNFLEQKKTSLQGSWNSLNVTETKQSVHQKFSGVKESVETAWREFDSKETYEKSRQLAIGAKEYYDREGAAKSFEALVEIGKENPGATLAAFAIPTVMMALCCLCCRRKSNDSSAGPSTAKVVQKSADPKGIVRSDSDHRPPEPRLESPHEEETKSPRDQHGAAVSLESELPPTGRSYEENFKSQPVDGGLPTAGTPRERSIRKPDGLPKSGSHGHLNRLGYLPQVAPRLQTPPFSPLLRSASDVPHSASPGVSPESLALLRNVDGVSPTPPPRADSDFTPRVKEQTVLVPPSFATPASSVFTPGSPHAGFTPHRLDFSRGADSLRAQSPFSSELVPPAASPRMTFSPPPAPISNESLDSKEFLTVADIVRNSNSPYLDFVPSRLLIAKMLAEFNDGVNSFGITYSKERGYSIPSENLAAFMKKHYPDARPKLGGQPSPTHSDDTVPPIATALSEASTPLRSRASTPPAALMLSSGNIALDYPEIAPNAIQEKLLLVHHAGINEYGIKIDSSGRALIPNANVASFMSTYFPADAGLEESDDSETDSSARSESPDLGTGGRSPAVHSPASSSGDSLERKGVTEPARISPKQGAGGSQLITAADINKSTHVKISDIKAKLNQIVATSAGDRFEVAMIPGTKPQPGIPQNQAAAFMREYFPSASPYKV